MSNPELDPQIEHCRSGEGPAPSEAGGLREDLPEARFTEGLSSGARVEDGDGCAVEILEPREVPLGGPRAMPVKRTLPQRARSLIGAWCFLDHFGPHDVAVAGGMDVARHPHTGLATV